MQDSIRDTTKKNYRSVWKQFNSFFIQLDEKPDTWEDRIVLFVGYLVDKNKRSQTVRSYISAIKNVLKNDGVYVNEDKILLKSLTRACRLKNDKVCTRLPIQKDLLRILLTGTVAHFNNEGQQYLAVVYKTLFCTAYFGLFRIGELTTGDHPIRVTDVQIADNKWKILFILRSSKTHGRDSKPQTVKITSRALNNAAGDSTGQTICPYMILKEYLAIRPKYKDVEEPFFVFRDRSAITPMNAMQVLCLILKQKGFNDKLYGTHGFRSGRALDLLRMNVPLPVIRILGRWQSNAVYTCLKS